MVEIERELVLMAQRVLDVNRYMVLGTLDTDGSPRLSPVRYTRNGYRDLYWASAYRSHHSGNIAARPLIRIVIYDSTAKNDQGEGVYLEAKAGVVSEEQLPTVCAGLGSRPTVTRHPAPADFSGTSPMRLYHAQVLSCEVHVSRFHPILGTGVDARRRVSLPAGEDEA
jgi:hypothetical protein